MQIGQAITIKANASFMHGHIVARSKMALKVELGAFQLWLPRKALKKVKSGFCETYELESWFTTNPTFKRCFHVGGLR